MIAALLREREGLVSQGKTDRVSQVDEQLKLYGYEDAEANTRKQAPQGRSAKPKQTTAKPDEG
jgi:hypothetical protein